MLPLQIKSKETLDILTIIPQFLIDADTRLTMSVNACHNPYWDVFMLLFSYKNVWLLFYVSLIWFLCRNYSWRFVVLSLLTVALLITLCDQMSSTWLRPMVQRLRPCDPENPLSEMVHLVNGYRPVSYSCPSAHAANTWGLAFFLSFVFRRKLLSATLILWAFVTCWSRLYLGVHFFGDLLAGLLIGLVLAWVIYYLMTWLLRLASRHHLIDLEGTCLAVIPDRQKWVPVAVLFLTVAVMMGYSVYCHCLS